MTYFAKYFLTTLGKRSNYHNITETYKPRTDFGMERKLALERTLGEDGAPGGNLYLTLLKSGGYELGRFGKTWPADEVKKDEDDEVEIVDEVRQFSLFPACLVLLHNFFHRRPFIKQPFIKQLLFLNRLPLVQIPYLQLVFSMVD